MQTSVLRSALLAPSPTYCNGDEARDEAVRKAAVPHCPAREAASHCAGNRQIRLAYAPNGPASLQMYVGSAFAKVIYGAAAMRDRTPDNAGDLHAGTEGRADGKKHFCSRQKAVHARRTRMNRLLIEGAISNRIPLCATICCGASIRPSYTN